MSDQDQKPTTDKTAQSTEVDVTKAVGQGDSVATTVVRLVLILLAVFVLVWTGRAIYNNLQNDQDSTTKPATTETQQLTTEAELTDIQPTQSTPETVRPAVDDEEITQAGGSIDNPIYLTIITGFLVALISRVTISLRYLLSTVRT